MTHEALEALKKAEKAVLDNLKIKSNNFKETIIQGELARVTMSKVWNYFNSNKTLDRVDFDKIVQEVAKDFKEHTDKIERLDSEIKN